MKIEAIKLKNFRAFKNTEIKKIPRFAVFVGANGTGKSSLFKLFEFLHEAMQSNVTSALAKLGGARGFKEVRSRNCSGPIEIEIKFRGNNEQWRLTTYNLIINEDKKTNKPIVEREILKYRRDSRGKPWHFINFFKGKGEAVTNEKDLSNIQDVTKLEREEQELKSPDLLAIKGLSQFEKFPIVKTLGELIEKWHISDFHIDQATKEQDYEYTKHLSKHGGNLSSVIDYLYKHQKKTFDEITQILPQRIPGITKVESKETEEGKILLKFYDENFPEEFLLARYVSDGTNKMLAYLVLLYDPQPHPLLCVEEPENQLYPSLLEELAEEFRSYSKKENQVFVSTHSPDFLNAIELEEIFLLKKSGGYTTVERPKDNKQIKSFMDNGDKMGHLWKQGFFKGIDP